jgi:hypothetical protein
MNFWTKTMKNHEKKNKKTKPLTYENKKKGHFADTDFYFRTIN